MTSWSRDRILRSPSWVAAVIENHCEKTNTEYTTLTTVAESDFQGGFGWLELMKKRRPGLHCTPSCVHVQERELPHRIAVTQGPERTFVEWFGQAI
ncbi:hypothetical protein CHARACLAT_032915 [Characodon lateralis]|uniref:Uncharacterized protein n=1 Tax=Characodon lateralis TaxID=208331 RepID=A0ABU7DEN1_9TELE|nr:hypothetical protein [Characodon lateralis]